MIKKGVLLGAVFIVIVAAVWLLLRSEQFKIKKIVIEGGERVHLDEVKSLIGIKVGDNIFGADTKRAQQALLKSFWIRDAKVKKAYPASLLITIEERKPFAVISSQKGYFWIDEEGYILESAKPVEPFISGPGVVRSFGGKRVEGSVMQTIRDLKSCGEGFLSRFTRFHIDKQNVLLFGQQKFHVIMERQGLKEGLELLRRLLKVIDGSHYIYIDMRFGDLVMMPR